MTDILLDTTTNDLLLQANDLKAGTCDQQHQALLLLFDKGSLKENPEAGVGAFKHIEAEDTAEFLREVRTQFAGDGMQINKIIFDNNKLLIDAPYHG